MSSSLPCAYCRCSACRLMRCLCSRGGVARTCSDSRGHAPVGTSGDLPLVDTSVLRTDVLILSKGNVEAVEGHEAENASPESLGGRSRGIHLSC